MHRAPPCQGGCPSGHDVRGWLNIVRGMEKPPVGMTWQEYAFYRMVSPIRSRPSWAASAPRRARTAATATRSKTTSASTPSSNISATTPLSTAEAARAGAPTGKRVAIIGGGPAGLACAYFLRRKGHACTIFEARAELGGMMRYGIPGYRTPRDVLDGEIKRILDMGVEVRTGVKIGVDITIEELERDYDAVFHGARRAGWNAARCAGASGAHNCITGIAFLEAFNEGRLQLGAGACS